ncbi:MAG: hypothetical protein QM755_21470 [Luteolibacter sp.]
MPTAQPGAATDLATLEKARTFAADDPEGGLRWLFSSGLILESQEDRPDGLRAFLGVLVAKNPRQALDFADLIDPLEQRIVYQLTAYDVLAKKDLTLAWQQWGERHAQHADEPVAILSLKDFQQFGLRHAWEELRKHHAAAALADLPLDSMAKDRRFKTEDASFVIQLLGAEDRSSLSVRDPDLVDALARLDPVGFGAWLEALPRDSNLDTAYAAMAWQSGRRHDFQSAQSWLQRIHDEGKREETMVYVRTQMSSTPVDVSPRAD